MAEITEAQARRICEMLKRDPDAPYYERIPDHVDRVFPLRHWPHDPLADYHVVSVPLWRVVQRAAAEGGEK